MFCAAKSFVLSLYYYYFFGVGIVDTNKKVNDKLTICCPFFNNTNVNDFFFICCYYYFECVLSLTGNVVVESSKKHRTKEVLCGARRMGGLTSVFPRDRPFNG